VPVIDVRCDDACRWFVVMVQNTLRLLQCCSDWEAANRSIAMAEVHQQRAGAVLYGATALVCWAVKGRRLLPTPKPPNHVTVYNDRVYGRSYWCKLETDASPIPLLPDGPGYQREGLDAAKKAATEMLEGSYNPVVQQGVWTSSQWGCVHQTLLRTPSAVPGDDFVRIGRALLRILRDVYCSGWSRVINGGSTPPPPPPPPLLPYRRNHHRRPMICDAVVTTTPAAVPGPPPPPPPPPSAVAAVTAAGAAKTGPKVQKEAAATTPTMLHLYMPPPPLLPYPTASPGVSSVTPDTAFACDALLLLAKTPTTAAAAVGRDDADDDDKTGVPPPPPPPPSPSATTKRPRFSQTVTNTVAAVAAAADDDEVKDALWTPSSAGRRPRRRRRLPQRLQDATPPSWPATAAAAAVAHQPMVVVVGTGGGETE